MTRSLICRLFIAAALSACTPIGPSPVARRPAIDVDAEVMNAESAWNKALQRADTVALESILATEFALVGMNPSRPPTQRAAWLGNLTSGRIRTDSVSSRDVVVTPFTQDSASAVLRLQWAASLGGLPSRLDVTRVEDTWVRRGGVWQVTRRKVLERLENRVP
jgi:hypothetical protein